MGIGRYTEIDTQRSSDSEKDKVRETADVKKPGYPGFFVRFRSSGQNSAAFGCILRGLAHIGKSSCAPASPRTLNQCQAQGLRY